MENVQGEREDRGGTNRGRKRDNDITIVVNGRRKAVDEKVLSFDEIVHLAFDDPPTGEFICFTITYRRGPRGNQQGTVDEGESVKIKNGMIFNVTVTDKS